MMYEYRISAAASSSGGRPGCGAGAGTSRQLRPCNPVRTLLSRFDSPRSLMSSARSQVQYPCSAGCAQPGLVRLTDIAGSRGQNALRPGNKVVTGQAAAPGRRRAPQSSRGTLQPCPCALNAHGFRKHLAAQLGLSCSLSALPPLQALACDALLQPDLCKHAVPDEGRNDATSSESGVGRAHPSNRRRSMLTVFHPSAHLRRGGTSSECPDGVTPMPRDCHHGGPHRRAGCLACSTWCTKALLCHFSGGQQPVLRTDNNGNITRCRPRNPQWAPQHASSPQTWH